MKHAEPELPAELSDRGWDIWEPLLAVAEAAGGAWPERAREAAVQLSGDQEADDDTFGIQLLWDVRVVFEEADVDRLPSADFVAHLRALEEAPWCYWGKSRKDPGLTQKDLANLLRPFGIRSRDRRFGEGTRKGYLRENFEDAWEHYLPPSGGSIRNKGNNGFVEPKTRPESSATEGSLLPLEKARKPHQKANVADVADRIPERTGDLFIDRVCRYPSHRPSDWTNDAGRRVCGICHPPVGDHAR